MTKMEIVEKLQDIDKTKKELIEKRKEYEKLLDDIATNEKISTRKSFVGRCFTHIKLDCGILYNPIGSERDIVAFKILNIYEENPNVAKCLIVREWDSISKSNSISISIEHINLWDSIPYNLSIIRDVPDLKVIDNYVEITDDSFNTIINSYLSQIKHAYGISDNNK